MAAATMPTLRPQPPSEASHRTQQIANTPATPTPQPAQSQRRPVQFSNFPIAGFASVGATVFTNPLEVIKTRLQLQGELARQGTYTKSYRNVFHAFVQVGRHDGWRGLQKGLSAALCFQFVLNAFRLGIFDTAMALGWADRESVARSFLWGSVGGVVGSCAGSPFFLVKTHMQSFSSTDIAVGFQRDHKTLRSAMANIYAVRGIRGLYRGVVGNIPRAALGSGAQLATFGPTKELMRSHGWQFEWPAANSFVCGAVAGSVMSLAITPPDIILTRMYNQPLDDAGRGKYYTGIGDCLMKVLRAEGLAGLYKGFWPSYFRIAPHSTLVLMFYDQLKEQRDAWFDAAATI